MYKNTIKAEKGIVKKVEGGLGRGELIDYDCPTLALALKLH